MYSQSNNALRKLSVANLINSLSTDNLAEGSTNLYFTDARAQTAVAQDIADAVAAEAAIRSAADATLTTNLEDEVTRATDAESTLASNLAAEVTRATTAEANITTAYQAADTSLQNQINNIISNVDPAALDSLTEIVAAFQDADTVISAAVTANADAISAETTNRQSADLVLQTNIDNVQAELDTTQSGAGLNADGTYTANGGTNYIDSATSLFGADVLLDSALKAMDTAYKAADVQHANDIASLEGRMTTAETDINTLEADLAAEILRATGAEAANAQAITDEINARAIAVQGAKDYADAQDALLIGDATVDGTAGNTITDRIATAVSDLQAYADTAEADAIASANAYSDANDATQTAALQAYADTAEADAITSANAYTDTEVAAVAADLATETTARTDADANLQTQINNILSNTDPAAIDSFTEVVAAFQAADSSLSGLISANQTAISLEATTREAADNTLQANIDAEAGTRASADTTLQANIDAEELARIAADSSIQAELDTTQAGSGLNADGTYTANGSSNYITGATSLKDADNLLDAALKAEADARAAADAAASGDLSAIDARVTTNEGDIATLETNLAGEIARASGAEATLQSNIDDVQAELDATQAGAGLAADGTYVANATANYISAATSLKDADNKLDAAVKVNEDAIATETQARIDAVAAEAALRVSGDSALQTAIDNEETRALAAESNLSDRITANDGDITALQNNLTTEIQNRTNADSALSDRIDTVESSAGLSVSGAYVADETKTYINDATTLFNADQQLDDAIVAETSRALAAEGVLQSNIDSISSSYQSADTAIQGELDATQTGAGLETDGSYVADATKVYINDATSLFNADQQLDDAIAAEVTRATTAEGVLTTDLAAEVSRATAAEGALDTRVTTNEGDITTLTTRLDTLVDGADTALDTLKEIGDAFTAADSSLQTLITDNSTRLTTNEADIDALEVYTGIDGPALNTTATDLTGAINELKAQVEDGSLSATDARVDNVVASEGTATDADGVWVGYTGTNYIDTATSFTNADELLDAAIKAEETRATGAEATLQSNIDTEAATRLANDNTLQANIDAEETARIGADNTLQANINTEASTRAAGDATLTTAINTVEASAGLTAAGAYVADTTKIYIDDATTLFNADQQLDDAIVAEVARATAAESALSGDVLAEETARIAADGVLQGNIDAEAATRLANDNTLQANIDAEATARTNADNQIITDYQAADTTLQQAIDTVEASAGLETDGSYVANGSANYISTATSLKGADNLLDSSLKAEADTRAAADTTLQNNINAEATTRATADTTLQTNIDNEANTRATADTNLQTQITSNLTEITATQSGAGLNTDGTYAGNTGTTYIDTASSLANADVLLDAAIAAEVTRATDAETVLTNSLNSEIATRAAADTALAGDIQTVADNLAQEILDRAAADTNLQGQIDFIVSNTDAAALDSLTEIVAAFQSADNTLEGAVLANQTAINNEVTRATDAEAALAADIAAEEAARIAADNTLQANIDGKVSKSGDTMSGVLDMGSNTIQGLAAGSLATDAVNKGQLDAGLAAQHISVFSTDDLAEGTNLYYTDARSRAAISVVDTEGNGDISYNSTTGVLTADLSKAMLELTDVVDNTYTGKQEYVLRVNATEDAMELVHASELQIFGQTYRQVIDGDGAATTYALDFLADTASTLVFVGGVIQDPTTHYSIDTGNQTITFTAPVPVGTQVVVVAREMVGAAPFIGTGAITEDKLASDIKVFTQSPNTAVGTGGSVVDSFDAATYRSAKYIIQVDNGAGEYETREALVIHDGTTAYITEYAMVYTGAGLLGDASVQMNAGTVELVYTANAAGTSVKVIGTYIDA